MDKPYRLIAPLLLLLSPVLSSGQTAGTTDSSFNLAFSSGGADAASYSIAFQPDGKFWVGGHYREINGQPHFNLARFLPNGTRENIPADSDDNVSSIFVQADGKILTAGNFQIRVARYNPDGTREATSTFNPFSGANYTVSTAVGQPDGKIILGGTFTSYNLAGPRIVRLNANASVENSATWNNGTGPNETVFTVALQPDGKILIGGLFTTVNGQPRNYIARLLPNGNLESIATFNPGTGANARIHCIAVQPDGKILIGGAFTTIDGQPRNRVARLNPDGSLESAATFNPGAGANADLYTFALQADGKILAGGGFTTFDGQPRSGIVRLHSNGALEDTASFNIGTGVSGGFLPGVLGITLRPDGRILIGGYFDQLNGSPRIRAARLLNDPATEKLSVTGGNRITWMRGGSAPEVGPVTFEYSTNGGTGWSAIGTATRISGGWERTGVGLPATGIIRARGRTHSGMYNASSGLIEQIISFGPGSPEPAFATSVSGEVQAIAVQPDHKILLGGFFSFVNGFPPRNHIARLLADGSAEDLDTFKTGEGASSRVQCVTMQTDGKILIGGEFTSVDGEPRNGIARLLADGTLEDVASFNPGPGVTGAVNSIALQSDGKILIGGSFAGAAGPLRGRVFRLNADGTVENPATFVQGTGANSAVHAVALQPDGKILIGGRFDQVNGQPRNGIARLHADGTLESTATFTVSTALNSFSGDVFSIVVQPDGKILIGGQFTAVNGQTRGNIARIHPNGTVESTATFNAGAGASDTRSTGAVHSIALQADGKILLGGQFTSVNGQVRNHLARLNANGTLESTGSFNPGTGAESDVYGVALQADGKIIIGGVFVNVNAEPHSHIARLANDPATQTLTATDRSRLQWVRGGASPEVEQAAFELSTTGGASWSPLGSGTRMPGGWEKTGLLLPSSGLIRARARTSSGEYNGSSGIVESVMPINFPAPEIVVLDGATSGAPPISSGHDQAVDFGVTRLPVAVTRNLTLANSGTAPLHISGVVLPPGFTAAGLPALPVTIAAGASLTIQLTLTASHPGQFGGTVSIASDDEDEPLFVFPVIGSAVTPEITVHPAISGVPELMDGQTAAIDFGRVVQGTHGIRYFVIANSGSAVLHVSRLDVPPAYTAFNVPPLPMALNPGQQMVFTVGLTEVNVGVHMGSAVITSDDLDETLFDFPLTGEVFIPDPVGSTVRAATTLNRQTGLREQTIHVANDTTATVPAYNLLVRGLPPGVEVNNASETRADGTVVVYIRQEMAPRSAQDVVIEYYSAGRTASEINPQLSTEVVLVPPDLTVPAGTQGLAIANLTRLDGGEILLEFTSVPGRYYQIQYSRDGQSWQVSQPTVRAAANRTQWIDRGLPRTDRHPALDANRFYRVREAGP